MRSPIISWRINKSTHPILHKSSPPETCPTARMMQALFQWRNASPRVNRNELSTLSIRPQRKQKVLAETTPLLLHLHTNRTMAAMTTTMKSLLLPPLYFHQIRWISRTMMRMMIIRCRRCRGLQFGWRWSSPGCHQVKIAGRRQGCKEEDDQQGKQMVSASFFYIDDDDVSAIFE